MDNNEERKPLLISNGMHYGARFNQNDQTPTSSPSRKVIYCVHGKPSTGCCKVLEGEVIDIDNSNVSIASNARENQDATNEINKHCHVTQSKEIDKNARKKLIIASILCVIFMLLEITGGYISGSLAIATDAAHLLTDFASFMISLFSIWMATRPATKNMPFGWYRAEVIGALTSVLLIWVVTGVLVYLAVQRVIEENFNIDAFVMLVTSAVGVGVNLIMGLTLHHHGHSHTMDNKKHSDENINVRAAFIHVVGDFLQSFGVFLAALVIYFKPEYRLIDPICTFIFSVIVLITTFNIIKDTLQVLMEGIPKGIDFNDVMGIFLEIEGVKRVHNLRIWALSLDKLALSAHLAIAPETNPQLILMMATKNIHEKYNFFEMTLQIEEFQEIMEDCYQCKNPV
ncbi:proton-coupled zinc antiporter SLC30A2-like [Onthophagus taurus]|uniref:proton-coupled zinc antiporter SLC30A2-like n=1 Tax=Onthophagus taurus TaxID=166361 RepID=UPI000C1FF2CE|nr:zinc transporter 2-like [Onthophagus taurus]